MAKDKPPPVPQPSFVDLHFPLSGLDVSHPFDQQPNRPTMVGYARTTRIGLNVRGYEPVTGRARGGQRSGLSKYLNAQVSGAHVIQHLNTITTVDGTGLSLGVPNDGSGGGGDGSGSGVGGSGGGGFQPGGPGTVNGAGILQLAIIVHDGSLVSGAQNFRLFLNGMQIGTVSTPALTSGASLFVSSASITTITSKWPVSPPVGAPSGPTVFPLSRGNNVLTLFNDTISFTSANSPTMEAFTTSFNGSAWVAVHNLVLFVGDNPNIAPGGSADFNFTMP